MRTIDPDALAVLSGPVVPIALLVELGFSSPVRLTSAAVTVQWGAALYYGTGSLGAVESVVDEAQGTQALRFTISAVPTEAIALALGEDVRGRSCIVRAAVLDPDTHAVLDAPVLWTGELDLMPITHGVDDCSIGVIAIHRGETFRRPKPQRYTDLDQQALFPGDTSLRYVLSQSQVADTWPAASYFRQ